MHDWWLPAGLVALLLVNAGRSGSGYPEPVVVPVALMVVAFLALGWRRRRPVAVAVTVTAAVTCYLLLLHGDLSVQPALEPFLVTLVALFGLALHAASRDFLLGLAAAGLPLVAVEMAAVVAGRELGTVVPTLVFWGAAVVLGRLLHVRAMEVSRAEQRVAEVEHRAEAAAAAERARIARELHDVVAHGLSVVVLHAGVERRLLDDPASSTWQTLDTIERSGRAALAELRHLLGLLQEPPLTRQPGALEPLPSLDRLDELVALARCSGHDVTLDLGASAADLPAGLGLSAYRIVQEALTNALKHAPGASISIRVDPAADGVTVEVANGAPATAAHVDLPSGGHGLPGMRERVKLYGGTLSAGPQPDGGFVVRALLPQESS